MSKNNIEENVQKRILNACNEHQQTQTQSQKDKKSNKMDGMFKEENEKFSSKRFVGIVGALILFGSIILSHFTEFKPEEYQINAVALLAAAALGFTSMEKMGNKNK